MKRNLVVKSLDDQLTKKEERWVGEFLVDLNASAACVRAGYSQKSTYDQGYQLLTKLHMHVDRELKERAVRTRTTADRVLMEVKRLALSNILNVCTWDEQGNVTVIASDKISPAVAASIVSLNATKTISPLGQVTSNIKIQLHPKTENLKTLGQHLGLFHEKIEVSGNVQHEHRKAIERSLKDLSPDELAALRVDLNKLLPEEIRSPTIEPEQLSRS